MVKLNINTNEINEANPIIDYYAFIDANKHLYIIGDGYDGKIPIIDISNDCQRSYIVETSTSIKEFREITNVGIVKIYQKYDDFELTFSEK